MAIGSILDIKFGFMMFAQSPEVLWSSIGSILSIAFFNFSGISVTKRMDNMHGHNALRGRRRTYLLKDHGLCTRVIPVISATSRTTIDALRTFLVWMVSLGLGWEEYAVRCCDVVCHRDWRR